MKKVFLCIDIKSFYASVECVDRGLNILNTNLVVADISRGRGTLCLAISPSMKALGINNRCRLFEIPNDIEYVIAKPRMKKYMEKCADIYSVYLKYVAKEDILVYSIDECFIDITNYLSLYKKDYKRLTKMILKDIYTSTGLIATAGIGSNMFLAKVALDIKAKHSKDYMYYLDEEIFQNELWHHRPITDFFKVGKGIAKRLAKYGVYDMYGITKLDKKLLHKEFGIDYELILDHAYGKESCTILEVQNYKRKGSSLSSGQVLFEDYNYEDTKLVIKEMVELLNEELIENNLVTKSISLSLGYSSRETFAHKSMVLDGYTDSLKQITEMFINIYDLIVDKSQYVRKIGISFSSLKDKVYQDINLFTYEKEEKENKIQKTILNIKSKYGKNSIVRGMNLQKKATTIQRNKQVGGHNG